MTHAAMETKKSHDQPPANWRTMKTSEVIQAELDGLRESTRESWRQEGNDVIPDNPENQK